MPTLALKPSLSMKSMFGSMAMRSMLPASGLDPIAAQRLGAIKRRIGIGEQPVGERLEIIVIARRGDDGDPDGSRQAALHLGRQFKGLRRHGGTNALSKLRRGNRA